MIVKSIRLSLAVLATTLALGTAAQAFALRTFVSSTGNDANTASNCAIAAPCRTLAQAFTVTSTNGEIIILDAGGFGALTINRPVAVIGTPGALIGVPAGGTGITVNVADGQVVTLRNLLITGGDGSNNKGIFHQGGELVVSNCVLRSLNFGIFLGTARAHVINTEIIGNFIGIYTIGIGVDTQVVPQTGPSWVILQGGSVVHNGIAYSMIGPGLRPSPATDNKITVLMSTIGGSLTTLHAGNNTLMTGSGTGCESPSNCKSVGAIAPQVNQNLN